MLNFCVNHPPLSPFNLSVILLRPLSISNLTIDKHMQRFSSFLPQRKRTFQTSKTPQGLSSPSLPTMGRHKGESQGQEVELGGQGRQSPNSRRTLPLKFVFLRSYMLCRLILMTFPFLGKLTTVTYPNMCGSGPPSLPTPSARCRSCAPDLPALGRPCL